MSSRLRGIARWPWPRLLFSAAVIVLHLVGCAEKVRTITPGRFVSITCHLESTPAWSYGYARGHHGTVLVRARNPRRGQPLGEACPDEGTPAIMARELRQYPLQVVGELALYLALIAWWMWGAGRLRAGLSVDQRGKSWRLAFGAFCWMVPWAVFLMPLLIFGYGTPLFRTFGMPSTHSTITYSGFGEGASILPMVFWLILQWVAPLPDPPGDLGLLALGLLLYGTAGVVHAFLDGPASATWARADCLTSAEGPSSRAGTCLS